MREYTIKNLAQYIDIIENNQSKILTNDTDASFVYRGQNLDLPLVPKLGRTTCDDLLIKEHKMLLEFKRANPLLLYPHQPLDDWDCLTLGQHYGLPTRLLDWSTNALTALWFAVKGDLRNSANSVVWTMWLSEEDFLPEYDKLSPFDVQETIFIRPRILKQRINNQSGVFSVGSNEDLLGEIAMDNNP